MKLLITRKKMIEIFAEELAYLQIRADWWYYVSKLKHEERQEMASKMLDDAIELRYICNEFGIVKEVYAEAYKIYDFRNSGRHNFVPDIELIKKLNREFCIPRKKKRPIIADVRRYN